MKRSLIIMTGIAVIAAGLAWTTYRPASAPAQAAAEPGDEETRKILYYRNPMGLPDTSPTPKKDSMGMDYIPVYADEMGDDGTVKVSPGKI